MSEDGDQHLPPDIESTPSLIPAVLRFLRVVRRRRRVVFQSLAICGALGLAYYAAAPRQYESAAKLLIIEQKQDQVATVGEHDAADNTMATHRELVASPVVLEAAIRRLAPAYRVDLVDRPPHEWVEELADRLEATTTRRTNFIDVSFRSRHPTAAAAVVRAVIESYLEFVRLTHQGTAAELKTVLTDERAKLAQNLAEKQAALQNFRRQAGSLALPESKGVVDPILQRALHLNDALMEAQQRRLELQAALASIDGAIERGEDLNQLLAGVDRAVGEQALLMALGMSPQDMELLADQEKKLLEAQQERQRLSPFLGPNHPRIGELGQHIADLATYLRDYRMNHGNQFDGAETAQRGARLKNVLSQALGQARSREAQLVASFEEARAIAAEHSGQLVEQQMLEREVERIENLHDLLFDKIANVDVRQVQAPIKATVVREPLPARRPAAPQLRFVVFASLVLGASLGGLIVYVQDVLDDRFNSPEELSSQLATPVLAMVRDLEPLDGEGLAGVHTHAMPTSPTTEAFRTLRTAITLSGATTDRLLICSSEPGDGKTTVAVNLAVAFAQGGKRTLVIDADLRKPGLTTRLALKSRCGLADVLASDEPVADVVGPAVQAIGLPGLDVLPTGIRRPNPAELLGGARFAELLAWAESQYDQVLVDCPPVLAVSDAQVVGRLVDGAILVVRPEANHRRSVMRAVESFRATGCPIIGVVANGISTDMNGYGYGYGYNYGYGDEHDEPDTLELPLADESPDQPHEEAMASESSELMRPRRAA